MDNKSGDTALAARLGFDEDVIADIRRHTAVKLKPIYEDDFVDKYSELDVPSNGLDVLLENRLSPEELAPLIDGLLDDLAPKGYVTFVHCDRRRVFEGTPIELHVIKTFDKYAPIAMMHTNGVNYGITTKDVIAKLKDWDSRYEIKIIGVSTGELELAFSRLPNKLESFMIEVLQFCRPVAAQLFDGEEGFRSLVMEFEKSRQLYLWWD